MNYRFPSNCMPYSRPQTVAVAYETLKQAADFLGSVEKVDAAAKTVRIRTSRRTNRVVVAARCLPGEVPGEGCVVAITVNAIRAPSCVVALKRLMRIYDLVAADASRAHINAVLAAEDDPPQTIPCGLFLLLILGVPFLIVACLHYFFPRP